MWFRHSSTCLLRDALKQDLLAGSSKHFGQGYTAISHDPFMGRGLPECSVGSDQERFPNSDSISRVALPVSFHKFIYEYPDIRAAYSGGNVQFKEKECR